MRIITRTHVKDAMSTYPQWRVGLQLWLDTFGKPGLSFESYQKTKDLWKEQSGWNVDRVPARQLIENQFQGENYDLYIFDIHGTQCRILTRIDKTRSKIFIRGIYTHAEYDKWCKSHIK